MSAQSFMVVRESIYSPTGTSYTGPFRSKASAEREAAAWVDSGTAAKVKPYTPELKTEVHAWQKAKRSR